VCFVTLSVRHSAYFYGDVEPGHEPAQWQAQIDALLHAHRDESHATPLVVNTHGWLDGVGRDLVQFVIRAARPTAIVELLDAHDTSLADALLAGDESGAAVVFRLPSLATTSTSAPIPQLPAVVSRRLALMRHVSGVSARALALLAVRPRRVAFAHVRVALPSSVQPAHVLRVLNAAVVALCCDTQTYAVANTSTSSASDAVQLLTTVPRLARCLALGVVRAVDVQQRVFYIVTALDDTQLAHVNTLVLGALTVPPDAIVQIASHNVSYFVICPMLACLILRCS
jgi:polynucleotide 5'-hydroxyl-kinase GRC3/NOL9